MSSNHKKGIKATLLELAPTNRTVFPRPSYSTLRTILSTLKIEYPHREFNYNVIDDGIEVICLK